MVASVLGVDDGCVREVGVGFVAAEHDAHRATESSVGYGDRRRCGQVAQDDRGWVDLDLHYLSSFDAHGGHDRAGDSCYLCRTSIVGDRVNLRLSIAAEEAVVAMLSNDGYAITIGQTG